MWGLFLKSLVFSFNLVVVSMRSWSLPVWHLGKILSLTWSVWMSGWRLSGLEPAPLGHATLLSLTTCGGGECWQGWVGVVLCITLRVSILCPLSLQCIIPAQCWYASGPTLAFQLPWTTSIFFLGVFCYDTIKLLVVLFNLLIFMIWSCCIDLNDYDVVWSHWNPDGDEPTGDGSAADDTTYNFFRYNECYLILVFEVFSTVPDLAFLIHRVWGVQR